MAKLAFALVAVAGAIALAFLSQSGPQIIDGQPLGPCRSADRTNCVVDGDTIWLQGVNYRLQGYDTPEEFNDIYGSFTEIDLARQATARLVNLLSQNPWELRSSGERDDHGRALASLFVSGEDVGKVLIGEGLARRWPDGAEL